MIANGQANPNRSQQEADQRPSIRRSFTDLARDAVQLAELQALLVQREATEGLRGLLLPVIILLTSIAFLLGAVPLVLFSIAQAFLNYTELGQVLSYALAAGIGLLLAVTFALAGLLLFKNRANIFQNSLTEFKHNVKWLKSTVTGD